MAALWTFVKTHLFTTVVLVLFTISTVAHFLPIRPFPPAPLPNPTPAPLPAAEPDQVLLDSVAWQGGKLVEVRAKAFGAPMFTWAGSSYYAAWLAPDGKTQSSVLLKIGKVDPGPGPDPKPDPKPNPDPTDALWLPLKAVWAQEPPATRAADCAQLAAIYQRWAGTAKTATGKLYELNQSMTKERKAEIGDRLPSIRAILNEESAKVLGTSTETTMDEATRDLCAKTFNRYAGLLKALR